MDDVGAKSIEWVMELNASDMTALHIKPLAIRKIQHAIQGGIDLTDLTDLTGAP